MKIKKASDGALTNFEVLNFLQSRGASREVAATVAPSEYKVFEYLVDTPAGSQTRQSVGDFLEKVKEYDLAKAEVLNIINTRPIVPVIFAIVENCENRLGEDRAESLWEMVTATLPPPPGEPENQDADQQDPANDDKGIDEDKGEANAS